MTAASSGLVLAACTSGKACLRSRPLTSWQHLEHHDMKNPTKKSHDCWAARILYEKNNETTFLSQNSGSRSPQFSDVYRLMLKEDGMLCERMFSQLSVWKQQQNFSVKSDLQSRPSIKSPVKLTFTSSEHPSVHRDTDVCNHVTAWVRGNLITPVSAISPSANTW